MKFALLNQSSVTSALVQKMVEAIRIHLGHLCAAWERLPVAIDFYPGATVAPAGEIPLVIFQHPDLAGALGYHDVDPLGRPYGRAFLSVIPGGAVLYDPSGLGQCLAAVLMHEADEIVGDEFATDWADGPFVDVKGGKQCASVARELCDPVQATAYFITLTDGTNVSATNFVLPSWFNPKSKGERYDYLSVLSAPLTVVAGGYVIARDAPGSERNVEAAEPVAHWRLVHGWLPGGRRGRRLPMAAAA